MWTYRCYVTKDQPDLWRVWYDAQSTVVKGKHDTAFDILETRTTWTPPHFKRLPGRNGLGEVILKGSVAWRIFGYQSGPEEFTVLHIGFHQEKKYTPRNVIDKAEARMKEVKRDESKAKVCNRPV